MKSLLDWTVMWLKAARAPFLIVSAIPACLGGAMAYAQGLFDALRFVLVLVGVVMAQSAADFIDDYCDYYAENFGNKDQQFHDSPLLAGQITPRQVLVAGLGCGAVALGIGAYLLWTVGMPVLYLGVAGAIFVVFYTSPPLRLNYRGLGEFVLFLAFGPALVLGVYYVLTGRLDVEPVLAAVPVGVFTMNVGHVSNTFDYDSDVKTGKRTLVVRFGQATAVRLLAASTVVAYGALVVGVALGLLATWSLSVLITLPLAWRVVRLAGRFDDLSSYEPAMGRAILLTTATGVLLCAAYLVPAVVV